MKSVYGPVSSWRLGRSLGIDPICNEEKICSFECVYCQLGEGKKIYERQEFVSLKRLKEDLKLIGDVEADVITFSGTGEPTLAKNLKEMVDYVRTVSNLPLAILTNSSLLTTEEVRTTLYRLDIVVSKLDAPNKMLFKTINGPYQGISFEKYLEGIRAFRKNYSGKFALQIMFVEKNKEYAGEMAELARDLEPDEIQINTPLRPCKVKPLSKEEIQEIKSAFSGFKRVVSVYEAERPEVSPVNLGEIQKRKRPKP